MRYMVLRTYDERYDFNFTMHWEEIEDIDKFLEKEIRQSGVEERRVDENGVIHSNITRRDFVSDSRSELAYLDDNFELIHFDVMIIVPEEAFWNYDFRIWNQIVTRNMKYGFIDVRG